MSIQFPLSIQFKKVAVTNKMTVTDGTGTVIAFAHQKLLKIKEQILLYGDTTKTMPIGEIRADRVIDFSPYYTYFDQTGQVVSAVKRNGSRSIFKADYDILDSSGNPIYKVREDNAWIKFFDALLGEIPLVGLFTGYFLNPKYNIFDLQGSVVAQVIKRPALIESSYVTDLRKADDPNIGLLPIALLSVISRERFRG